MQTFGEKFVLVRAKLRRNVGIFKFYINEDTRRVSKFNTVELTMMEEVNDGGTVVNHSKKRHKKVESLKRKFHVFVCELIMTNGVQTLHHHFHTKQTQQYHKKKTRKKVESVLKNSENIPSPACVGGASRESSPC